MDLGKFVCIVENFTRKTGFEINKNKSAVSNQEIDNFAKYLSGDSYKYLGIY